MESASAAPIVTNGSGNLRMTYSPQHHINICRPNTSTGSRQFAAWLARYWAPTRLRPWINLTGVSSTFLACRRGSQSPARPSQAATIITAKHHAATMPRGAVVRNIGGLSQSFLSVLGSATRVCAEDLIPSLDPPTPDQAYLNRPPPHRRRRCPIAKTEKGGCSD